MESNMEQDMCMGGITIWGSLIGLGHWGIFCTCIRPAWERVFRLLQHHPRLLSRLLQHHPAFQHKTRHVSSGCTPTGAATFQSREFLQTSTHLCLLEEGVKCGFHVCPPKL